MNNKKLIIEIIAIIVIAACLCIGYYQYDKSKNAVEEINNETDVISNNEDNIAAEEDIEENNENEEYAEADEEVIATTNVENQLGVLKVPSININRGFVKDEKNDGSCMNNNICAIDFNDKFYEKNNSLVLAAHGDMSTSGYFKQINELTSESKAYIEYNGVKYTYRLIGSYKDARGDKAISFNNNSSSKSILHLFTTKDSKFYYIVDFELIGQEKIK